MNGQGFYQQQSQPQQQQQRQCPPQQNIATANGGAAVYSSANLQNYQQTYATGFQGVGIYAQAGVDNAYYHHQYANVAFPNYSVAQQQGCYSTAGLVSMIPAQQQQHHQQPMYFTTAGQQHCYPVAYSPVYYQQPTYQDHRNDNLLKQMLVLLLLYKWGPEFAHNCLLRLPKMHSTNWFLFHLKLKFFSFCDSIYWAKQ